LLFFSFEGLFLSHLLSFQDEWKVHGKGWDMPVGFSVGVRAQQPDFSFQSPILLRVEWWNVYFLPF
jgi:hypothetical protein